MEIGDLAPVYRLGERLFTSNAFPTLYRTWDSFEVTYYYNADSDYCLVAEDGEGRVIGFALGSTVEKDNSPWKYGYLAWIGVAPEYHGRKVADRLLREFEKRMKDEGVRILLVDTEAGNHRALKFFQHNGFAQSKSHVWLSKSLIRDHQACPEPVEGKGTKPLKPIARIQKKSNGRGKMAKTTQVADVNGHGGPGLSESEGIDQPEALAQVS